MKAITARKAAAHITPLMDAMWHRGIVTAEDCIFDSFEKFAADIASNNEVRIRSGVGMLQGRFFCIEPGTYDSAAISNGTQGEKRIDLIVARWTVNASSETEDVEIKVIQGTPTTDTPVAPDYTEGDLDNGELVADLPLYEVNVNGINIESLSAQFETGWLLRNGPLPVSKGGTGGTSAAGARQNINYIGIDPIMGGTANDTPANWAALGSGIAKINESGIVLNKPTTCGIIISNVVDGNVTQIWQGLTSNGMWFRQSADNSWGTWKKILDEDSGVQMVKLWENASPTSNFLAQTVNLDLSNYKAVLIVFRTSWWDGSSEHVKTGCKSEMIRKGDIGVLDSAETTKTSPYYTMSKQRVVTLNDTGATFNSGHMGCLNTNGTDNASCIPYIIYGIKGVD